MPSIVSQWACATISLSSATFSHVSVCVFAGGRSIWLPVNTSIKIINTFYIWFFLLLLTSLSCPSYNFTFIFFFLPVTIVCLIWMVFHYYLWIINNDYWNLTRILKLLSSIWIHSGNFNELACRYWKCRERALAFILDLFPIC